MTNKEFSEQFDTLIPLYNFEFGNSNLPPKFNEYLKSVFLTMALNQLAISIYNGSYKGSEAFENTEELRRYLSNVIRTDKPVEDTEYSDKLNPNSLVFLLKDDVMFITYELATLVNDTCLNGKTISVMPVTLDLFYKLSRNPFRGPNNNRALRLDLEGNKVEIVSKYKVKDYQIRYIKTLDPIILEDLPNGLTINNKSKESSCELHEALHLLVLLIAVKTALSTRSKDV